MYHGGRQVLNRVCWSMIRPLGTAIAHGLTRTALAERERWPLWLPVGVGIGVALYFALAREPAIWVGPAGLGAAAALAVLGRRRVALLLPALAAGSLAAGLAAGQIRTYVLATPMLTREIGPVRVEGRAVAVEALPGARRVILEQVAIEGLAPDATPRRVRIRLAGRLPPIDPGQWMSARATLAPPSPPSAPGTYDFQRHAFFEGIGAVGFAFGAATVATPPAGTPEPSAVAVRLAGLRQSMTARILERLPGAAGAIAAALVTGDQGAIPKEAVQAMRDSGIIHLLSISGLHMAFVAGILFFGVRAVLALIPPLALAQPIKKWAAAAALVGTLFYLFLSGAPVPAQRSFIMAALILLAVILDRSAISMRLIAWAATAVLLLRPETLTGPSFQMSFAAVVALIAAYEAARDWRTERRAAAGWPRRAVQGAGELALTSLIATLATAPYVVFHFNRLAEYGVAANMLAVPLTGFWIMPWAVVASIAMPFGLDGAAWAPMGWGIEGLLAIARTVAAWPGAAVLVPAMPLAGLATLTLGGLWLCLWQRRWRYFGLVGIAAGLATMAFAVPPDLLVSDDGKLIALRDASGRLLLSSGRAARFDSELWLRRAAQDERIVWPRDAPSADGALACDELGCLYRRAGRIVALVRDPAALDEDCAIADLVVSLEPVRGPCAAPRVVDRFDLWRYGGHAVWLTEREIRVVSVGEPRGRRPWVVRPEPAQ